MSGEVETSEASEAGFELRFSVEERVRQKFEDIHIGVAILRNCSSESESKSEGKSEGVGGVTAEKAGKGIEREWICLLYTSPRMPTILILEPSTLTNTSSSIRVSCFPSLRMIKTCLLYTSPSPRDRG